MSNKSRAAQGSAAPKTDLKYKDMGAAQKIVFVGKACIFFLTLGFAFPNIFLD